MPADFRVSAIMHSCFDYKFNAASTATLAREAAMLACAMVSVIPGGWRTRL
jgi:predicted glycosyltransferase